MKRLLIPFLICRYAPPPGGIVNLLLAVLITTVGIKTIEKFGAASIMLTIVGILAVPTITFGPPGIYKIFMLFVVGFIYDLVLILLRRNRFGYIIAGGAVGLSAAPLIYVFLILFGLPGADKLQPMLAIFSVVYAILGAIGAYLGLWIFDKKLKNKAFVKQMQG